MFTFWSIGSPVFYAYMHNFYDCFRTVLCFVSSFFHLTADHKHCSMSLNLLAKPDSQGLHRGAPYGRAMIGGSSGQVLRPIAPGMRRLSLVDKTQARTLCPSWEEY